MGRNSSRISRLLPPLLLFFLLLLLHTTPQCGKLTASNSITAVIFYHSFVVGVLVSLPLDLSKEREVCIVK
jgi:hypothetical protein